MSRYRPHRGKDGDRQATDDPPGKRHTGVALPCESACVSPHVAVVPSGARASAGEHVAPGRRDFQRHARRDCSLLAGTSDPDGSLLEMHAPGIAAPAPDVQTRAWLVTCVLLLATILSGLVVLDVRLKHVCLRRRGIAAQAL